MPRAGVPLCLTLLVVNLLLGLLSLTFLISTSVSVGQTPGAVAVGADSAAWDGVFLAFAVSAVAFLALQALAPFQLALGELLARRIDGALFRRLMRASLSGHGTGPLEDRALLDLHAEASRELDHTLQSPGKGCAGMMALTGRYVQVAGCAVIIALTVALPLALVVTCLVLVLRYGHRGGLRKYATVLGSLAARRRRSNYLRDVSVDASSGKEIRLFGLTSWLRGAYEKAHQEWLARVWAARRRIYLWPFIVYAGIGLVLSSAALVSTVYLGGQDDGTQAFTELVLGLQAIMLSLRLAEHYPEADVPTQYGMTALAALRDFERGAAAHAASEGDRGGCRTRPPTLTSGIHFENVSFGYPGGETVLDGLTMRLPAGRSTAIVGVNGAGKTTIAHLLAGLRRPTEGEIRVDGTRLDSLSIEDWRRRVAVIFQNPLRYDASAKDNIGFGAVEYRHAQEDIVAAAREAGIADVLDALPAGMDTPLARHMAGGVDLSGGQWQRMALARALFAARRGASLMILDEPTASLDVRAEARFYAEFLRRLDGITTVVISHRFSTVREADNIVVLDNGRVLEQGTHDELVAAAGRYAELFHLQADQYLSPGNPPAREA